MIGKILIVEDDPFTQQFYKFLFAKTGREIIISENTDEIFSLLNEKQIALMILDINLTNTTLQGEKTDGIQLSKYIKSNENFNLVPILLITAYQNPGGSKDYLKISMADDYIVKPITDFNALLSKVKKLIGN